MSRHVIRLFQDDTAPTLTIQFFDENTGVPIDLAAGTSSVTGKFRKKGTTTILQTITGTKVDGGYAGIAQFQFAALAYPKATYEMEYTVIKDGLIQTCEDKTLHPLALDF